MKYRQRVVDKELASSLERAGAVQIIGPKACGKTLSARQIAKSEIRVDTDPQVAAAMQTDPQRLLIGATPRLLDEWQEQQILWNYVRHEVDDRQAKGQFILAGSANPVEDIKLHSGAGRIERLAMRPMTWSEVGFSTKEVSLAALLRGDEPYSQPLGIKIADVAEQIARGGWPEQLEATTKNALVSNRRYLSLITEVDISRVSNKRRDPLRVQSLLASYARNTAIPATISTLTNDAVGKDTVSTRETVVDYIDALARLMIVEDLPAWNAHLRSKAALRQNPKRHLVDPSLAVAALDANIDALLDDLVFLGFLFESVVLRDLRVYAQALEAKLCHYRDSNRNETDIILQLPNNSWAAFEVKLGFGGADEGAASLQRLAKTVDEQKTGKLLALTVITGLGFAHRRPDGVNVVPLATLTA
jgi:predicted AAA+ superfamily ATPase